MHTTILDKDHSQLNAQGPWIAPAPCTHGPLFTAVDLHKHFVPHLPILRGINLEIVQGEFVTIIGRSGSGKSTLLRLLAGLEKPSKGGIFVDKTPLHGLNPAARVMFQDARLMPWLRIRENVGLGLKGNWQPLAEQALEEVGLLDRAKDWPAILSGGQRQRVALARALASRPQYLLLDEPLGALDALTRRDMQQLIEKLWQLHRFTAILITHDVEEAVALGDRVILIEEGRIAYNFPVPFPRPRERANREFVSLRETILKHVYKD